MISTYTIAIETATNKGSVSLFRGEQEIAFWIGDDRETLSSSLLPQISRLLSENGLTAADLALIAACTGPGSFTGIRVGLSVARGLQAALDVPAAGVSLPQILALSQENQDREIVTVIPAGREEVYLQGFSAAAAPSGDIRLSRADEVASMSGSAVIVATADLKDEQRQLIETSVAGKVSAAPGNLARFVAQAAIQGKEASRRSLSPLYVKEFGR